VTATEPPKWTDVSAFIYDDKGHKKESLRAHEIHVVSDPNINAKYEIEGARNDEGQEKIIELQRQVEGWKSWQEEQTRAQVAYASGAYYTGVRCTSISGSVHTGGSASLKHSGGRVPDTSH